MRRKDRFMASMLAITLAALTMVMEPTAVLAEGAAQEVAEEATDEVAVKTAGETSEEAADESMDVTSDEDTEGTLENAEEATNDASEVIAKEAEDVAADNVTEEELSAETTTESINSLKDGNMFSLTPSVIYRYDYTEGREGSFAFLNTGNVSLKVKYCNEDGEGDTYEFATGEVFSATMFHSGEYITIWTDETNKGQAFFYNMVKATNDVVSNSETFTVYDTGLGAAAHGVKYYEIDAATLKNGRVYQLTLDYMDAADLYMGRYYDTCFEDTTDPTAGVISFSKLTPVFGNAGNLIFEFQKAGNKNLVFFTAPRTSGMGTFHHGAYAEKTLPTLAMGDNTVSSKADEEVFYKFTVSENGIYEIYGKDVILGADDEEEGPIELKLWDKDGNENDYDSGGSRLYAYRAVYFEAKAWDTFYVSFLRGSNTPFNICLKKVPQLVFTDGTYQTESLNSLRHYLYHADKTGYLNLKIEDGGLSMIAVGAYFNGIDSQNRTYIVNEGQDYILKVWPDDEESSASLTITGRFDEASYLADKPLYDLNEKVMDATRMRYNNGYRAGKDADYDTFGDFEIVNKTDEYTFYAYRYDKALILKAYEEYQKLSDKQKKAFDTYFKDRRDVLLAGYEKATEGQAKPPAVADKQDDTSSQTNDTQTSVGAKTTVQGAEYQVVAEGQVKYIKPSNQKKTSYSVPATVKIAGKTMAVTVFDTKSMKGCSKMKSLTVGKNVTKIVGKGLNGKKKLKKVTIKSTKITKVDKGAFKNLAKGAKIYLPKKMKTKYKKLFKKNVIGNAKIVWK